MSNDNHSTSTSTASGPSPRPGAERFFGWMRSLGIVRQDGWIGGVCGGIAARLGIDPIIVRGIAVVVLLLGGPALLVYAAAWLLLPDAHDDIHLEMLLRGRFETAIVGIGVLVLLAMLPVTQGFWWAGANWWGEPQWPLSIGRTLWTLVVIAAIVAFVIWLSRSSRWAGQRRTGGSGVWSATAADSSTASTVSTDATSAHAADSSADTTAAETRPLNAEPRHPEPPASNANDEELGAWRARQTAWRDEHRRWQQEQADAQRAVRQQRSAELRAQAQQMAALAREERRLRRLANPRTSGAFVGITLGSALIVAGIAAWSASAATDVAAYTVTIGFAAAALVVGLSIMVAGIMRRRSGFLSFVSILLVATAVLTALPPRDRTLVMPYASFSSTADVHAYQPVGRIEVNIDEASLPAVGHRVIRLDQWMGLTTVWVDGDVDVRFQVTQHASSSDIDALSIPADGDNPETLPVSNRRMTDGAHESRLSIGNDSAGRFVLVRIDQGGGAVQIRQLNATN